MIEKIKAVTFLILSLIIVFLFCICVMLGALLTNKGKSSFYPAEKKAEYKLMKDFERLAKLIGTPEFEKQYKKYWFDPTKFDEWETYGNNAIVITDFFGANNEKNADMLKLKKDFNNYYLYNQIFFRVNYIDLRGE